MGLPAELKPFIWVDYSIIGAASFSLSTGMLRGFSHRIVSLLCLVIAFWMSLHFAVDMSERLQTLIHTNHKRLFVAFIGLFIATFLGGSLLQYWIMIRFKQNYTHTAFMECLGGLICGIMQSVVIITLIVFLSGLTSIPHNIWWQESSLLPFFQTIAIELRDHVALHMTNAVTYR